MGGGFAEILSSLLLRLGRRPGRLQRLLPFLRRLGILPPQVLLSLPFFLEPLRHVDRLIGGLVRVSLHLPPGEDLRQNKSENQNKLNIEKDTKIVILRRREQINTDGRKDQGSALYLYGKKRTKGKHTQRSFPGKQQAFLSSTALPASR